MNENDSAKLLRAIFERKAVFEKRVLNWYNFHSKLSFSNLGIQYKCLFK